MVKAHKLGAVILISGAFAVCNLPQAWSAQLQPHTSRAYDRYIRAAEARMERDRSRPGHFLYIDSLPPSDRRAIRSELRQGDIYVTRPVARDAKGNAIEAPDGWIHDWLAAMFVPNVTLKQAVATDQDYDKYSSYYKPEMVRSRILAHSDDTFKVYARVQKKTPWLTVTLDTYNNVQYHWVDPRHLYSVSRSFRIQQVDDAGTPQEHLDPPGDGTGFLWELDVYWRYEAVKGGIVIESETIALTRSLPFGLEWIIKPFVHRSAEATERQLMTRTRQVIEERAKSEADESGSS